MDSFHETLFPLEIGFGATGGPERRTDIVTLASGHEERNARWANSRRSFDAGVGVRSLADLQTVIAFFEEQRGRLIGFRFRDPFDNRSSKSGEAVSALDQTIGNGDGTNRVFQLKKTYGSAHQPFERIISKPVAASVKVAIDGVETTALSIDGTSGQLTFDAAPQNGGGHFSRVPVRYSGAL